MCTRAAVHIILAPPPAALPSVLTRARQEGELVPDENEPELIPPEQVLVENVVRDSRVKFFGIPKLGAYLALPINYGSWLHPGGGVRNSRVPLIPRERGADRRRRIWRAREVWCWRTYFTIIFTNVESILAPKTVVHTARFGSEGASRRGERREVGRV